MQAQDELRHKEKETKRKNKKRLIKCTELNELIITQRR